MDKEKQRRYKMKCPKCGSDLTYDEVDIGVGVMQGNARCDNCGWVQEEEDILLNKVRVKEVQDDR